MISFKKYIIDKLLYLISFIGMEITVILMLNLLSLDTKIIIILCIFILFSYSLPLIVEYYKKKFFYNNLSEKLNNLDKKTLLTEVIANPEFLEGQIFYDALKQISKSMNDTIGEYNKEVRDYTEFIDLWVHEIKTPITTTKLISSNNSQNSILEELEKIEKYVQQVLYYSKSFYANYDFNVQCLNIDEIVNSAIKNNAKILITNKVLVKKARLKGVVYSDKKWLQFILNQIIINSVQFMDKDEKVIEFFIEEDSDVIRLVIKDNGMGISSKDINKVFNKGFVGENGRIKGKSTGFGLYICKKLCYSLNIDLSLVSQKGEYTSTVLTFKND